MEVNDCLVLLHKKSSRKWYALGGWTLAVGLLLSGSYAILNANHNLMVYRSSLKSHQDSLAQLRASKNDVNKLSRIEYQENCSRMTLTSIGERETERFYGIAAAGVSVVPAAFAVFFARRCQSQQAFARESDDLDE